MLDTAWAGTLRRWRNEGLPRDVAWEDYFGFDHCIRIRPDNSPRFERKIIEKTDRYRIETTTWGGTVKTFNELDSTPEVLDLFYDSSDKWEMAKAEMLKYHDDRINWKSLAENYPKWQSEGIKYRIIKLLN